MSRDSLPWASVPPPLPPPRHMLHGPEKGDQSQPDIAWRWKESGTPVIPSPSLYGGFDTRGRANTEEERRSLTHYPSQPATSSYDASLLNKLDSRTGNTSTTSEGGGFNWSEQLRLCAEMSVSQSQGPSFSTSLSSMGKDESVLGKTSYNLLPMSLSLPIVQSNPGFSDSPLSLRDNDVYYQMSGQFNPRMMQGLQYGGLEREELVPTAIVIKNIPFTVKKEQLVALMSEMQLPLPYAFNYHFDNGFFRGLAFANFTDPEETRHVINAMNHMELQGRKLRVEYKKMLPLEERERIAREKRQKRGQLQRAYSLPRNDHSPSLHRVGSTSDFYRRRESASRQSPKPGIYSGYASSNHSSTSIRSCGSNNSYTCSVRSARGIPDTDSDNRFSDLERRHSSVGNSTSPRHLSPCGLSRKYSTHEIHNVGRGVVRSSEGDHQTWEEFCVLQLVAFLQVCTLDDVHALTQSPTLLGKRFKFYLKRMISQEGNIDFLSYQASPRPSQPEPQLQLLRHQKSILSQSRSLVRSYSSRTSHSSASTASSFSSQISDGTLLNHLQQEAKSLKDCLVKIQKKLKHLEKELQGTQSNKGQERPAVESATLTTLVETNKTAIEWLHSKEGDLGLLGFSDMSLLFAKFHREFAAVYKDLQSLKRQNKIKKVFMPRRSKQEVGERRMKYVQIEQAVHNMMSGIYAGLEAAETQKAAFIAAGKPYVSVSISEAVADLGYAPHDTFAGSFPETRQFIKIDNPRLQGYFMCECCPKKRKKFDTVEELWAHENEKQYECTYCRNRFKNENEAERHQHSLHARRLSWSCAAISGYEAAFHPSLRTPNEADTCGYCGEEFRRTGPVDDLGIKIASERDWELRIEHLSEGHKFGECNDAKKFFRADHFRMHLKHSHSGTSGKWTNMLENACMKDEPLPEPIRGLNGKNP
ncbi:hypothetical protein V490_05931 [Pseudogymnoascus sp. VKM F-3557]|nr:hypothetical protein V490_05931 [Pseudogymnoascus sp. VKM F-3557]